MRNYLPAVGMGIAGFVYRFVATAFKRKEKTMKRIRILLPILALICLAPTAGYGGYGRTVAGLLKEARQLSRLWERHQRCVTRQDDRKDTCSRLADHDWSYFAEIFGQLADISACMADSDKKDECAYERCRCLSEAETKSDQKACESELRTCKTMIENYPDR